MKRHYQDGQTVSTERKSVQILQLFIGNGGVSICIEPRLISNKNVKRWKSINKSINDIVKWAHYKRRVVCGKRCCVIILKI